jgi:signal transduction histidine kinase
MALWDTLRTLAMRAHTKGLVSHVLPDVPDALVGVAGRLRQVLLNLVGNAVKFTEEREVVVRVEFVGDSALEEVRVRFPRQAAHKLARMVAVFSTPAGELAGSVEDCAIT